MNDRIRAILERQPNLAAFCREAGVSYYAAYYFLKTPGANISAENAMRVLEASGGRDVGRKMSRCGAEGGGE